MFRGWALTGALLVVLAAGGCGGDKPAKIENVSNLQGKVIASVIPAVPTKHVEASMEKYIGGKVKEFKFFNKYPDCVLALQSGKVDAVLTAKFLGDYYVKRNADLKMISSEPVKVNVVMAVRNEDAQLKDDLDKAIATLGDSGKLKSLEAEWVTNLPVGNEPANKLADPIPGAKTVYVGLCGDYVPLDYIAANGRPAGYNVALLNEIGKLLGVNFEFVSMESQAKFAALSSKKIDLIFCNLDANTPGLQALKDKSWVATRPYYTSEVGSFLVKK